MIEVKNEQKKSKFLSFVLRHKPQAIGIHIDSKGWVEVEELLSKLPPKNSLTKEELDAIVDNDKKRRYSFSEDGLKIRANQGHSIKVEVELEEKEPPEFLYHGTIEKFLPSIMKQGLIKGSRTHVHLSDNIETAKAVGARRGVPVILRVESKKDYASGNNYYLSENGVWLVEEVNSQFIKEI